MAEKEAQWYRIIHPSGVISKAYADSISYLETNLYHVILRRNGEIVAIGPSDTLVVLD